MTHHEWGMLIVIYLFMGGLGAGSLVLSGAAHLAQRPRFRGIARAGALAAPVLVALGSGLLIFDLGNPLRFWRLFVTINPVSPMSVGSWLLVFFVMISSVYAVLHLPPNWLLAAARRLPRTAVPLRALARWNMPENPRHLDHAPAGEPFPGSPPRIRTLRKSLALVGIPLCQSLVIYTGVLLGAIPARPFWNTPMVAQLFLFSALSTASALLLLLTPLVWSAGHQQREHERMALIRADLVFIFLELFLIVPFVVHGELGARSGRAALDMIQGGPYTGIFWIGVVTIGILIPMAIEIFESIGSARKLPRPVLSGLHVAVPVMILVGGYLLRWVFVHAGQDTGFI
jgi:formate-dependent nitrite reductase membrane component NrfD